MVDAKDIEKIEKTFGKIVEIPKKHKSIKIKLLVYFVSDTRRKHDSGYPFIRIFGISEKRVYDLGWHDHFVSYIPINTDSLGKNIFRISSYRKMQIKRAFFSSTFMIRENGDLE